MDPRDRPPGVLLAPSYSSASGPLRAPGRDEPRPPPVDERIVMPESRAEIVGGELVLAPPAEEPHAVHHLRLAYVLAAHVREGWLAAVDLLTRAGEREDFAPDASVYPAARDPETGRRQLEELAFEIVSEQAIGVPSEKARALVRRGVRRVFCVVVKRQRVLEWSRETDAFGPLADDAALEDPCFYRPLRVRALLDATAADDDVAHALLARDGPVLRTAIEQSEAKGRTEGKIEGKIEGKTEGKTEGKAEAVLALLAARGLTVSDALRRRVLACADLATLERWIVRAALAEGDAEAVLDGS